MSEENLAGADAESIRLRESQARVQKKTFTNWWNSYLKERNLKIQDLFVDLADGLMVVNLLEILTNSKIEGVSRQPKYRAQMVSNVELSWEFLQARFDDKTLHQVLKQIGPLNITDGNGTLILGLTWHLILFFELKKLVTVQDLFAWCRFSLSPYPITIENMSSSFSSGLALASLIHAHHPHLIDLDSLDRDDPEGNLNKVFAIAEKELGVPILLDAVDVVNEPDEKSIITYLARLNRALDPDGSLSRKASIDEGLSGLAGKRLMSVENLNKRGSVVGDRMRRFMISSEDVNRGSTEDIPRSKSTLNLAAPQPDMRRSASNESVKTSAVPQKSTSTEEIKTTIKTPQGKSTEDINKIVTTTSTTTTTTTEIVPNLPKFDDLKREKKSLSDGVLFFTTPNENRFLRYEVENPHSDKKVKFTISFEESENVKLEYPNNGKLIAEETVMPGERKLLAILNPQVDPYSPARQKLKFTWLTTDIEDHNTN